MTKENLGQFFTPDSIVDQMISLIENQGTILEPSCGAGAFSNKIQNCIALEIDKKVAPKNAIITDFFDWNTPVDTIIGNPPYVRYQDIFPSTKEKLPNKFDSRTNLYIFFIDRCIDLLKSNGELIFIVPRDFIKTTGAIPLNKRLYEEGGFTYWQEFGDQKIFADATPNVVIFRWVKGIAHTILINYTNGFLSFGEQTSKKTIPINELFDILVGGASGANSIFIEPTGNIDLVVSDTKKTGLTKKAHYVDAPTDYLLAHKITLMNRKIKVFNENNWWEWGRKIRHINGDKIYVNNKTRDMTPFFTNDSGWFDGSILALVPKDTNPYSIEQLIKMLNNNNWEEQGFKVGGRLIFGQRTLSNANLIIDI